MVVLAAKLMRTRRSMTFFAAQAFVNGSMIYEGEIMGSIL
jgi:3-hydroxymyristoyl/3-hydroxydecanoyl-(acyl carrier protein) dehydratase